MKRVYISKQTVHGRDRLIECDVGNWRDIVSVAVGWLHTIGLQKDGTVVANGDNFYEQCAEIWRWRDIVAVTVRNWNIVGLKRGGTVVVVGVNADLKLQENAEQILQFFGGGGR